MEFGMLRMEDRKVRFTREGQEQVVSYKELLWAYREKDVQAGGNGLVFHTRTKEKYQFRMSDAEAEECLKILKKKNPAIELGYPAGNRLPLNSLDNTRDLGAIAAKGGHYILPGRLLRSGDLYHVSGSDQEELRRTCKLKTVIDFRTETERSERPDEIIYGVEYITNPVLEESTVGITREKDKMGQLFEFAGDGEAYMLHFYENLVLDRKAQSAYGNFLRLLKHHSEGAVLWHCTAGKDRVGMGTALLLQILGVSREDILEDYMRSAVYLRPETEAMLRMLDNRGASRRVLKNVEIILGVKESYLLRAFEKIEEKYGTMDKYSKKALGLTNFDMNFLKDRYLF